jgi:hypothetical protein
LTLRLRRFALYHPVGLGGATGFFCAVSTATLKFLVFPVFSAERFAILV